MAKCPTDFKKNYRMLVIGETGVGKSSLIELIRNYALQLDQDFDIKKVCKLNPNLREDDSMTSDNTLATTYSVDLPDLVLHITDTPGFFDTRGEEQRKINLDEIISKVKKLEYINCICLVFNGTIARITDLLHSVIQEILKLLLPEVLQNIIVVFTNTPSKRNLNFKLEVLNTNYNLSVPQTHSFFLENPFCWWMKEIKESGDITSNASCDITEAFKKTSSELSKIIELVKTFKEVPAKRFGELHTIILDMQNHIHAMKSDLDKKLLLTRACDEKTGTLMMMEEFKDFKKAWINSDNKSVICPKLMKICHQNCNCSLTSGVFGRMRNCQTFRFGTCRNCGEPASSHKKIRLTLIKEIPQLEEENLQRKREDLHADEEDLKSCREKCHKWAMKLLHYVVMFQKVGSKQHLVNVMSEQTKELKHDLKMSPDFQEKADLEKIIDMQTTDIKELSLDNLSAEFKTAWAEGMLDLKAGTYRRDDINTKYRELSTKEDSTDKLKTYYSLAKIHLEFNLVSKS